MDTHTSDTDISFPLLAELSTHPILDPETERTLAWQMVRGRDPNAAPEVYDHARAARDRLILSNIRLVIRIASDLRHCRSPSWSLYDSIQAGLIGLVIAVDNYDPTYQVKLSTYATYWIRQAIERSFMNHGRTVRIPVHRVERYRKLRATEIDLMLHGRHDISIHDLASYLGWSATDIQSIIQHMQVPISLDAPWSVDPERGDTLRDHLPAPDPSVEEVALAAIDTADIATALLRLPERDRHVIILRFGLDGHPPRSLREVGEIVGITREGVRQIEQRALRQLRMWFLHGSPHDQTASA